MSTVVYFQLGQPPYLLLEALGEPQHHRYRPCPPYLPVSLPILEGFVLLVVLNGRIGPFLETYPHVRPKGRPGSPDQDP